MYQSVPQPKSNDVLPCAQSRRHAGADTHSFMSQCVQCGARIWVACSSPIEPKRMCVLCSPA